MYQIQLTEIAIANLFDHSRVCDIFCKVKNTYPHTHIYTIYKITQIFLSINEILRRKKQNHP